MSYLDTILQGVEVVWKSLGEVVEIKTGQAVSKEVISVNPGKYPVINSGREPLGFINEWNTDNDPIGITTRGAGVGSITWQEGKYFRGNLNYSLTIFNNKVIDTRYLYHLLFYMQADIHALCTFDGIPALNAGNFKNLQIPIPPLSFQKEIVRILDTFTEHTAELTAELIARKKQYDYYRKVLLSFEEGKLEWKTLGEVCLSITAGGDVPENSIKGQTVPTYEYPYPIYANATGEGGLYGFTDGYKIENDAVTISARGAKIGYHTIRDGKFTSIIRLITLVTNKNIISTKFLNYILYMTPIGGDEGGIPQLTVPTVKKLRIPIPSLEEQERIVSILDKFDILTTSNSEGLPKEIELRKKQYAYYRDLLLTFPSLRTAGEAIQKNNTKR